MSRAAERQPGPDSRRYRTLAGWVIAVLLAVELVSLLVWLVRAPPPPFSDFFGLWSFAKFVRLAGSAIYHPAALQAFQRQLDPALRGSYPCPYPPSALLLLAPFVLFAAVQWMSLAALPLVVPALLAILLIATCAGDYPLEAASGQAGTSGFSPPPPAGPSARGAASPRASASAAAAAGLSRSTSCGNRR